MAKPKVAIAVAEFNRPLVDAMVASCEDELARAGAERSVVVRVPGCYELPLVVDGILARRDVDAVVVLGYIERGETTHGEVMGHVVHGALMKLCLGHGKPMGLGIIGPGATAAQAELRKDAYARAAVRAALATLAALPARRGSARGRASRAKAAPRRRGGRR